MLPSKWFDATLIVEKKIHRKTPFLFLLPQGLIGLFIDTVKGKIDLESRRASALKMVRR